jgi:hypothetical protein
MERYWRLFYPSLFALFLYGNPPAFSASTKTVIADGDNLAGSEAKVLQQSQRNAVEEEGVYFEATFHDVGKEAGGRSTQTSSCEIYLRLNQPEQAIEDLSTVIRVDPTNAAALVTRAKLYRERL